MDFYSKLFWKQGMMLRPHHLQHLDVHHQLSSWRLMRLFHPYMWGIVNINLDMTSARQGQAVVRDFEGVLPDGVWIRKGENAEFVGAQFETHKVTSGMMIYIGVHRLVGDQSNLTLISGSSHEDVRTRFVGVKGSSVKLWNLYEKDDTPVAADQLRYLVRVFTDQNLEESKEHVLMPVAYLRRDSNNELIQDPDYLPPSMQIGTCPLILEILQDIFDVLRSSIAQLEVYKATESTVIKESNKDSESALTQSVLKYRFALAVFSRYLARIKYLLTEHKNHPYEAYKTIHELACELSFFTDKVSVLSMEDASHAISSMYDHLDAGKSFADLRKVCRQLVDEVTVSEDLNVTLEDNGSGMFSSVIPESMFGINNHFYIVVVTKEPYTEWLETFNTFCKVSSVGKIQDLINRALPGLKISYLDERPAGLPSRRNAYYFALDRSGSNWEDVNNSRTIALKWDDAPEDARIDLSVVEV